MAPRKRTEKTCVICAKTFLAWDRRGITCSSECRKEHRLRVERIRRGDDRIGPREAVCDVCLKPFTQIGNRRSKRCSETCSEKAQSRYRTSERVRAIQNQSSTGWAARNREKMRAEGRARYARDVGWITRSPCEVCGSEKTEMHHDDYAKPLEVRWLCRQHHKDVHKREPS